MEKNNKNSPCVNVNAYVKHFVGFHKFHRNFIKYNTRCMLVYVNLLLGEYEYKHKIFSFFHLTQFLYSRFVIEI